MRYVDYNGTPVRLVPESYRSDGSLALRMVEQDGGDYAIATVNLGHPFQSDKLVFLDENNIPGIGEWIELNGFGFPLGPRARSGFSEYPLFMIFRERL